MKVQYHINAQNEIIFIATTDAIFFCTLWEKWVIAIFQTESPNNNKILVSVITWYCKGYTLFTISDCFGDEITIFNLAWG